MSKILCVDDESFIRNLLKFSLEKFGFESEGVENGYECLDYLKKFSDTDLIILDVMMPQMDGFTLYEKIRAVDQKTPILFLTAKKSEDSIVRGLELGAEDYITKPFNIKTLELKIKKAIGQPLTVTTASQ